MFWILHLQVVDYVTDSCVLTKNNEVKSPFLLFWITSTSCNTCKLCANLPRKLLNKHSRGWARTWKHYCCNWCWKQGWLTRNPDMSIQLVEWGGVALSVLWWTFIGKTTKLIKLFELLQFSQFIRYNFWLFDISKIKNFFRFLYLIFLVVFSAQSCVCF